MLCIMHKLPKELQSKIYQYDSTYYDIFENCLFDIRHSLYVTYNVRHKRTNYGKNMIETYTIQKIGRKKFTPSQQKKFIKNTFMYKFIVDTYYSMEYDDFREFYSWFYKNKNNMDKLDDENKIIIQ